METLFSKSGSDYHDLDVKLEDDEEDELGPIVDTPFRARCYTWPRQYLQQQQGQATSPSFRNSCFLIFIVVTFKKKNWRSTIFFIYWGTTQSKDLLLYTIWRLLHSTISWYLFGLLSSPVQMSQWTPGWSTGKIALYQTLIIATTNEQNSWKSISNAERGRPEGSTERCLSTK